MFLFPPQTTKMNHVKALLRLQFPLSNGGDLWTKDEIVQDTERILLGGWWMNHKTTFPILYEVFLFVMAHVMSSAQIETDFSPAFGVVVE